MPWTCKECGAEAGMLGCSNPACSSVQKMDMQVYVLKRRGNYYGIFLNEETAREFLEFKRRKEKNPLFQDVDGCVHIMPLSDVLTKIGYRRAEVN